MNFYLFALTAMVAKLVSAMPPNTGSLWISTIDNPRQCQSSVVVIQGGQGPYKLYVVRGDNYDGQLAQVSDRLDAGNIPWTCNVQAGTAFALKLVDCHGNVAYSAARTVEAGTNDCCQSNALLVGSPGQSCACDEPAPQPNPQPAPAPVQPTTVYQVQTTAYAVPTRYTTVTVRVQKQPERGDTCFGATPTNTGRWGGRAKRAWYDHKVSDDSDTDRSHGEPAVIWQTQTVTAYDDGSGASECSSAFKLHLHLATIASGLVLAGYLLA